LHKAWSSQAKRPKYQDFAEALNAAAEKIEEYYEKTSTSHAYTLVMCEYSFFISIDMFIISRQCLIPRKKWIISRNIGARNYKKKLKDRLRKL